MNIQYDNDHWTTDDLNAPPQPRLTLEAPQCDAGPVIRCRSMRGAKRIALSFYAPDFVSVRINGVAPPPSPPKFRSRLAPGWHLVMRSRRERSADRNRPPEERAAGCRGERSDVWVAAGSGAARPRASGHKRSAE
jgi:hypothetical protein